MCVVLYCIVLCVLCAVGLVAWNKEDDDDDDDNTNNAKFSLTCRC